MSSKVRHKCKTCKGTGRVLFFYTNQWGKDACKDIECDECKGTGYIEKLSSGSDIIFPLDKKGK
jgi:DnaJ-class molecular chaperone